jgi:pimeloyl-[acyl-carrier protein] methyl ester esterase
VRLHVDRHGSGPDLVLLHGWGLHSGVWADVAPQLGTRFRVHAVDLPGHGFSSETVVQQFDDAAALVGEHIPPRAVLCGWSLGGLLAQRIIHLGAADVRSLALVSSTPCFVEREGWKAAMKPATLQTFASGLAIDTEATLDNFVRLNALNGVRTRDAMRAFSGRLFERGRPTVESLAIGLQWLRDVDLRGDAAFITQRTAVIHGARDALAPIDAGRWLARELPNANLTELADAAHLPFFTHPAEFVQALESLIG